MTRQFMQAVDKSKYVYVWLYDKRETVCSGGKNVPAGSSVEESACEVDASSDFFAVEILSTGDAIHEEVEIPFVHIHLARHLNILNIIIIYKKDK